jgi:HPt (histidine-containing phosphotransfer) domain-containing protein
MVDVELNDLKREFLDEARVKVLEMQAALESASSESFDRVTYLAHQLKGSGGSYGYERISTDAAAIEKALETRSATGNGNSLDAQIQQHVINLRAEIDRCSKELLLLPH